MVGLGDLQVMDDPVIDLVLHSMIPPHPALKLSMPIVGAREGPVSNAEEGERKGVTDYSNSVQCMVCRSKVRSDLV
jgi:hypothetical protein